MVKKINEKFFHTWTQESAYILGFIYADGHLTKDGEAIRVGMSSNDLQLLTDINNAMGSEYKISVDNKNKNPNYRTGFYRKEMSDRLMELGLTLNKSKTITFPDVPLDYLPHFIRGYFDGNGHFTYEIHKEGKRRMVSGFTFGSEEFGKGLVEALKSLGISERTIHFRDRRDSGRGCYYEISMMVRDTRKLAELMYRDDTIRLERKKDKYYSIPNK